MHILGINGASVRKARIGYVHWQQGSGSNRGSYRACHFYADKAQQKAFRPLSSRKLLLPDRGLIDEKMGKDYPPSGNCCRKNVEIL